MKKLMIAAAIVCAAAVSQAANYAWGNYDSSVYASGTTEYIEGTAYLFDASVTSTANLLSAFALGTDISTLAVPGADGFATEGYVAYIDDEKFSYDGHATGESWSAYYAIVNGEEIFLSETYLTKAQATATDEIVFSDVTAASQAAAKDIGEGYKGAGWYAAVPEPTSGLLLLLGVAGLALRRRRA